MKETIHPIIIELFGLPGCGKTTLRDNLVKYSGRDRTYSLMTELSSQYRHLPFWRKIQHIPWKMWWLLLRFFMSMPLLPLKEWVYYKVFFSFALIYSYSRYAKGSSFIIVDHGFVQAVVSLMHGHLTRLSKNQEIRFIEITRLLPNTKFVYCKLPAEVSFQRIRSRKRDVGRLDVLKDDELLRNQLIEEKYIFESLYEGFNALGYQKCYMLDSALSVDNCVNNLTDIIVR